MVTSKQRRRTLAHAKWRRQYERRTTDAHRRRRIGWVVSVIVGLIAAAALVWLILYIVDQQKEDDAPVIPDRPIETGLLPPSNDDLIPTSDGPATSGPTGEPTSAPGSQ